MSRSNTHYHSICRPHNSQIFLWDEFLVREDGFCDFHRAHGDWWKPHKRCTPEREFMTRRGIWKRTERFPDWSWKSAVSGPPPRIKQLWNQQLRAKYTAEMRRHPDDPELIDGPKWLAGMYQYWS